MAKKKIDTDVVKPKSLFSHLKQITDVQNPDYWETLTDADKKNFSVYMIHRFLSMNENWLELVSELQPYTESLPPELFYKLYIGLIPKGRHYSKYIKGKGVDKYSKELIDTLRIDYQCSTNEALDYIEILYSTLEGREHIKYVCQKYGIDKKNVTKLKLGLKKK